ncbi:ATP-binding protein [Uliginosibacterium sp. 31-16]|uniref:ATP-binding protein n=1 Tax=Uliginosibacterium sp. 31-16 TaxID=3068315 RepID=UPI00273FDE61|nr:ATP-binding protein [Uliginosibacterium sp. 31-16]MDP5240560.1 ATP-binding protein [Uliginosibacterium sp. 31-16]
MTSFCSVRSRLLFVVGFGVVVATLAQAVVAYRVALTEVDTISDFHMIEMARAVGRSMPQTMTQIVPMPAGDRLPVSEDNCFTLRIQRKEGVPSVSVAPQHVQRVFSIRKDGSKSLRVLEVDAPDVHIEVSHDLAVRAQTAGALAFRTILPVIATAPLLLLCVAWGVRHALRPLRKARREIGERAADDLRPLTTEGVPDEAQPFVREINSLFARINTEFEARRNFVADVAHELRSPLAALKLQVECLARAQTPETRSLAHERVVAGISRATRLVEQLLVLAREDAAPPGYSVTTLPQVARLALSDAFTLAHARQIDLGADLQENLPEAVFTVCGDVEALRTLLRNVLDNAVKYTPAGGVVNMTLQREPEAIILRIEDSGPGIPAEERERLFERFQRGSSGQDAGGSGLGLAIVRTIANRQGIEMTLDTSATLGGLAVVLRFRPATPPGSAGGPVETSRSEA